MADSLTDNRARNYEIGFLVAPTVPADEAAEMSDQIQSAITDAGGELLADKTPDMRDLAYTMEVQTSAGTNEFKRAQFGWVQFSLQPGSLDEVRDALEGMEDVMRHLLVTIDEEDIGVSTADEDGEQSEESESDEAEDEGGAEADEENAEDTD